MYRYLLYRYLLYRHLLYRHLLYRHLLYRHLLYRHWIISKSIRPSLDLRSPSADLWTQKEKQEQNNKKKRARSNNSFSNSSKPGKGQKRKKYTNQEDQTLYQFVQSNSFQTASGNKLWQEAEKNKLLPDRSWQSMRDRYLNYPGGVKKDTKSLKNNDTRAKPLKMKQNSSPSMPSSPSSSSSSSSFPVPGERTKTTHANQMLSNSIQYQTRAKPIQTNPASSSSSSSSSFPTHTKTTPTNNLDPISSASQSPASQENVSSQEQTSSQEHTFDLKKNQSKKNVSFSSSSPLPLNDQNNDALEAAALMFMSSSKAQDIKTFMNISSSSRSLILKNWASKTSSKNWLGEFKPLFCKQSMPWSIGDDIRVLNLRRDNDTKRSRQIQRLLPERTHQSVNTRFKLLQKLFDGSVAKYKTDTKSLRKILRDY